MRYLMTLMAFSLLSCSLAVAEEQSLAQTGGVVILDEGALAFIDPDARINQLGEGYKWTEGPVWIENGDYLLFSDIPNNRVMKYSGTGQPELYLDNAGATGLQPTDSRQGSNGLLLNAQDQLVLFQHGDRRVAIMDAPLTSPTSKYITLADQFDGKRLNSPNDGVFHSNGDLYFTDPPYGMNQGMNDPNKELDFQGVYRLDTQKQLHLVDDSVSYPNGIGLSVDEKTLYVAVSDPANQVWLAYDLQPDGSATNKRVFFDAGAASDTGEHGLPDGLTVHSSGYLFATGPGGVWLFNPDGKPLARIMTGRATANCTLSPDEKTLYMTAKDTLMSISLR